MSEETLANYIDARKTDGDAATVPPDEETQGLVGTVMLAEAGLGTPAPSEEAERQSRERLVSQMEDGALQTKSLRAEPVDTSLMGRIKRWMRGER